MAPATSDPRPGGVLAQDYELVDVSQLQVHPDNPRQGDIGAIAKSIAINGFFGAVVVQKSTSRILAGNHRFEAAKGEGLKQIPVIWIDCDDAAALKILLADNKLSDDAVYDETALATLLMDARNQGNLEGTGYTEVDLGELFKRMGDEILKAAEPEEKKSGEGRTELEYRVIVECESEEQQTELLERFEAEGLECKPLIS